MARFSHEYGTRYLKAVEAFTRDRDRSLTFFDFPPEHWFRLRTTNPIESTSSMVKARKKKTKGAGSRRAGLFMAFKLLLATEKCWRRVNAPHLVTLIKAGLEFPNREAEMLRSEPASEDLLAYTPSIFATRESTIHSI